MHFFGGYLCLLLIFIMMNLWLKNWGRIYLEKKLWNSFHFEIAD